MADNKEVKKEWLFKIGVISVFIIILALWLLNLRGVFSTNTNKDYDFSWQKVSAEIEKNTRETEEKMGFNKPKTASSSDFMKQVLDGASDLSSKSISTSTAILEIRKELLDLTKNATNSDNKNCPAYIDCMPRIGEAKPCVIPLGCEKITQIAY